MAENNRESFPNYFGSSNTQGNSSLQNSQHHFNPNSPYFQIPYPQLFSQNLSNTANVAPANYFPTMMGGQFGIPSSQVFFHPPPPQTESRRTSVGGSSSENETPSPFQFVGSQFPPHSTQPDVQNPRDDSNESQRSNKGKATWTHDEEKCLAQAWSTISNCSIVGNSQKNKEFWEKTSAYYNDNRPPNTPYRSGAAIKSHFYHIMPDVYAFSGWYNNFYSNRASGQSDDDVLQATMDQWHTVHPKKTFKYMHIWRVLKELEKWAPQSANKKSKTSESESHTLTETEVRSRPMGQQRAKRQGKSKVKISDEDRLEKWKSLQQIQEDRIKQKEVELMQKDYEIFMKDTTGMTSAQLQCHMMIIADIKARRNW